MRGEPGEEIRDTLVHRFARLRVFLEVCNGLRETDVDAVVVVEEVGGEFLETLEVFDKNAFAHARVLARRLRFQYVEIKFRFFRFAFYASIVPLFVFLQQSYKKMCHPRLPGEALEAGLVRPLASYIPQRCSSPSLCKDGDVGPDPCSLKFLDGTGIHRFYFFSWNAWKFARQLIHYPFLIIHA